MSLCVVRARRRLRVVLDGEDWVFAVFDAFDRSIVEVKVGHLKAIRTWYAARLAADRKAVILRSDKYLPRREIANRMVPAAVSIRELHSLAAHCQAEQLMAQADAEDREVAVRQVSDRVDRVPNGGGVTRPVRQENPIRFERTHLICSRRRGDDGNATTFLDEQSQDVAFHPEVERHDVMCRARAPFGVRAGNRGRARKVETVHGRR